MDAYRVMELDLDEEDGYLETFEEAVMVRLREDGLLITREWYADGEVINAVELQYDQLDARYQPVVYDVIMGMALGDSIDVQPEMDAVDARYNRLDHLYDDLLPAPGYVWWGTETGR